MVARQRVVRAQLGEERHHHPPNRIPALRVLLALKRLLKDLERPTVVALVPCLEGRRQLGIAGQTGACEQPVGHEVSPRALEQLDRLVGIAAPQQQLAEFAPSGRVVRVELDGSAQRLLVAARGELVGLGGHECVESGPPRRAAAHR